MTLARAPTRTLRKRVPASTVLCMTVSATHIVPGIVVGFIVIMASVEFFFPPDPATPERQVEVLEKKLNGQFTNLATSQQDCETVAPFLEGTTLIGETNEHEAVTVRFVKHVTYQQNTTVCSGTLVSDSLPEPRKGLLFAAVSHRPEQVYCYSALSTERTPSFWNAVPGVKAYPWKLQMCHELYAPLTSNLSL